VTPPPSRFPSLLFLTRPEPLSYGKEAPAKMRLSQGTEARQRLALRKIRCCRLGGHNSSLPEKELGMVLTWDPKAGTLELVGLLIPFLTHPKDMAGKHVVLGVDKTSVIYAWDKRYFRNDPETSLLIRVLYVIEAFLRCRFMLHM
jgi:hypothetical protein